MTNNDVTPRGGVQLAEAIEYSPYVLKLAGAEKLRYGEKLTLINGQDPFLLGSSGIEK